MNPDLEALKALVELAKKAGAHEWAIDGDDRPGMEWNNFIVQADVRKTLEKLRQHSHQDRAGWVSVPREPTESMCVCGVKYDVQPFVASCIYKAMLAAAEEGKS